MPRPTESLSLDLELGDGEVVAQFGREQGHGLAVVGRGILIRS